MKTSFSASIFRNSQRTRLISLPNARLFNQSSEDYNHLYSPLKSSPTFEDAGLRPALAKAVHAAFPNVNGPTEIQSTLISNVMKGKDIILQDETGSGKSFGLILALLNKPRVVFGNKPGSTPKRHPITSLLLVPHKDLALQMLHWVELIIQASAVDPPPLTSIAQVLVREGRRHLTEGLQLIRNEPPFLLISTPSSVLEVLEEDSNAFDVRELSTVALDEVDYMIETLPMKDNESKEYLKKLRKLEKHPGPARMLLDEIYADRVKLAGEARETMANAPHHSPQLILSSATIRRQLKHYFFSEKQYLNSSAVKIRGAVMRLHGRDELATAELAMRSLISHHVLVASDEGILNLPIAVAAEDEDELHVSFDDPNSEGSESVPSTSDEIAERRSVGRQTAGFSMTPSPLNQNSLEAVAAVFALDVPSIALLVIPSNASVHRAVYDLKEMGVNALGMDLLVQERGRSYLLQADTERPKANPVLLVCTPSSIRGVDLPSLSHVFILGFETLLTKDWTSTLDNYIHLCGRTGRFKKRGKVITVVEQKSVPRIEKVLNVLEIVPVRLKMFE
ncbi:hypothetical protein GYMLUDRAFT_147826 [Collybiopsis luxurians FD-317 M1]|nr:hypothetical protein GYMLUDRAFT_147826 [Collybiopsis luxurians FD-317 M1]